jgi:hypothetical protein
MNKKIQRAAAGAGAGVQYLIHNNSKSMLPFSQNVSSILESLLGFRPTAIYFLFCQGFVNRLLTLLKTS